MSIAGVSRITATAAPMTRRAGDAALVGTSNATNTPLEKTSGTALVALTPAVSAGSGSLNLNRPDPSFVTQLLATAESLPQTRTLRRAAIADVEAAYRSAANQNDMSDWIPGTGIRRTA
jgi:hypothetical protein